MLRQYFCSRVDGLIPAASRRILFKHPWCLLTSVLVFESHLRRILLTRPWCLFRARPAFVLVCEDHLCHETGVLYEALVSMFRVCIGLRLSYTSAAGPDWRLRSSYAEQLPKEMCKKNHKPNSALYRSNNCSCNSHGVDP